MSDIPTWPAKLTREQQKGGKQRFKDFDAALKRQAGAAGWRFARGEVFRQTGDWFITTRPSLLWERGALVRMTIKPMAVDPLFWDIVGLSENAVLPLSFRAMGAWVLQPRSNDGHIGLKTIEVEQLAAEVLKWANEQANEKLSTISVETMLAELPKEECLRGQQRALAICLHILTGDLDAALHLCRVERPDPHLISEESGGFAMRNHDGSVATFLDRAREWIVRKRRDELSVVLA